MALLLPLALHFRFCISSSKSVHLNSLSCLPLYLRMTFVDMNAIEFYKQPPLKAVLSGNKWPSATNCNIPTLGQQCESCQALKRSYQSSCRLRLRDHSVIKSVDMTASPPNEPLDIFDKIGPEVKATELDAEGEFFRFLYE